MNLNSTSRLIQLLRANGVDYFKTPEIEIRFGAVEAHPRASVVGSEPSSVPHGTGPMSVGQAAVSQWQTTQQAAQTQQGQAAIDPNFARLLQENARNLQNAPATNAGDVPVKEVQIPHQINEMISVMKMSDEELVDRMFPEGAPPDGSGGG